MDCLNFKYFVLDKDYACTGFYSIEENRWVESPPRYQFNAAEGIGNTLLEPMKWVFQTLDATDCSCTYLYAIVASVFALAIALIGALFKKLGEAANPHSYLRQEALEQSQIIYDLTYHDKIALVEADNYNYECAAKKSEEEMTQLFSTSTKSGATPRRVLVRRWNEAWKNFNITRQAGEDLSSFKATIKTMASGDEELSKKVTDYFENLRARQEKANKRLQAFLQFNEIVAQFT